MLSLTTFELLNLMIHICLSLGVVLLREETCVSSFLLWFENLYNLIYNKYIMYRFLDIYYLKVYQKELMSNEIYRFTKESYKEYFA